jgi:hypothetical protein
VSITNDHHESKIFKIDNSADVPINVMFEPWASTLTLLENDTLEIFYELNDSQSDHPTVGLSVTKDEFIVELNAWGYYNFKIKLNGELLSNMIY